VNCAAYRDACLKYHPDKCGAVMMDEEAKEKCEERFKHIQEAFDVSPS
jgi:DnaJ-class molecular chaperone